MGIKVYKAYTPSRRNMTGLDFDVITTDKPEKSLLASKNKTAGRNNQGKITVRHHGGGNRQKYRIIDFKRNKDDIEAKVATIEYDPNRTANIALLVYADGTVCEQVFQGREGFGIFDGNVARDTELGPVFFDGLRLQFQIVIDELCAVRNLHDLGFFIKQRHQFADQASCNHDLLCGKLQALLDHFFCINPSIQEEEVSGAIVQSVRCS